MTATGIESLVEQIERSRQELSNAMADTELVSDRARFAEVNRRWSHLQTAFQLVDQWRDAAGRASEAQELLAEADDDDMRALHREAVDEMESLAGEIREAMIEPDPNDERDVIVEIRAAAGGQEAALFARDLMDLYTRYAQSHRYKVEQMSSSGADAGGIKEVTLSIKGKGAFSIFKHEAGVHRVQRVPETESQGRIHTSTATVAVLPEVEDVEVKVEDKDIKVDVYRSSGPGGQSVNTTDSAVRITHLPTGIVVSMQDEKSQLQNRERAMRVLRARLYERAIAEQTAEITAARRAQLGTGERSEKVRTYNYPQNRVTDHRVNMTVPLREQVLQGALEELTAALAADERRQLLAEQAERGTT